jgi:FAD/FMN-containing dehydrogenase
MKHVKDIVFNDDMSTVTVGAGNTFAETYTAIEKRNVMIVGGRFGTVGTGLLLGAGFSYLNNRHGLAVDNVAGHRVVLANGTVVLANVTHFSDLHWALKGGGNNFGVVTHFELFTIPSDGVYGGRLTYPPSSVDGLLEAAYKYHVDTAINDIDVHVLPTFVYDAISNTTYGYTPVVYNKNATSFPPSLQAWIDVPHTNNTAKQRRYADLANELVAGFPDGLV